MLDVRKPIALFFFIIGAIVCVYGFVRPETIPVVTPHGAYPVNLNIPWGGVMVAFALAMGSLALWDDASSEEAVLLEKERAEREAQEAEEEEGEEGEAESDSAEAEPENAEAESSSTGSADADDAVEGGDAGDTKSSGD